MDYIKVSEAALKWGLSARRVRILCEEGHIEGVIRKGKLYMILVNALKPQDGRSTAKSRVELGKKYGGNLLIIQSFILVYQLHLKNSLLITLRFMKMHTLR